MRGGEQARNTLPVSCDGKQNHICCWLFESQRDGLSRAPIFVPVASICFSAYKPTLPISTCVISKLGLGGTSIRA